MSSIHLVRWGVLGELGRFPARDRILYPRGTDVICRTPRGLEIGQVLTPMSGSAQKSTPAATDGQVLRAMTAEDRLLAERLARHRVQALDACQQLLAERGIPTTLLEVEHLFDGQSVYFYFLGEASPELESITSELARAYDANVQFQQFARTLAEGCGPACGSHHAAGSDCGSGCQTCAVMHACHGARQH